MKEPNKNCRKKIYPFIIIITVKQGKERNTLSILSSTTKTRDKLSQEAIFIYIDRFNNNNYKFCCL